KYEANTAILHARTKRMEELRAERDRLAALVEQLKADYDSQNLTDLNVALDALAERNKQLELAREHFQRIIEEERAHRMAVTAPMVIASHALAQLAPTAAQPFDEKTGGIMDYLKCRTCNGEGWMQAEGRDGEMCPDCQNPIVLGGTGLVDGLLTREMAQQVKKSSDAALEKHDRAIRREVAAKAARVCGTYAD